MYSRENESFKQINTAALFSNSTNKPMKPNTLEIGVKNNSNNLSVSKVMNKNNRSVENTPASKLKDGSPSNIIDNNSRRERSLSVNTDESFEPCGFMDYYKAYKQDNSIPPSEIGREDSENSASLKPPIFKSSLLRRNTVEVNHSNIINALKGKEIPAISEQNEEVN